MTEHMCRDRSPLVLLWTVVFLISSSQASKTDWKAEHRAVKSNPNQFTSERRTTRRRKLIEECQAPSGTALGRFDARGSWGSFSSV